MTQTQRRPRVSDGLGMNATAKRALAVLALFRDVRGMTQLELVLAERTAVYLLERAREIESGRTVGGKGQ